MTQAELTLPRRSFGQTMRAESGGPSHCCFSRPGSVCVYSTWAAFQGKNYYFGPYLSPFYSPELFGASPHSWFGPKPVWWPAWLLFSPALLVLWAPGGFRLTCYYYRGAYYKASGPIHRPALWVSRARLTSASVRSRSSCRMCTAIFSTSRSCSSSCSPMMSGKRSGLLIRKPAGLRSGWASARWSSRLMSCSLAATLSVVIPCAIWSADFSINSRNRPTCYRAYACVGCLNRRHMLWAWMSLFWVGFSDVYVRLCALGVWHDLRFF